MDLFLHFNRPSGRVVSEIKERGAPCVVSKPYGAWSKACDQ